MRALSLFGLALAAGASVASFLFQPSKAEAYEVDRYTVYCADDRIEVSMWDFAQMIVRRGNPVCQFASYTSYSDALIFARKNFGGEGKDCFCQ